MKELSRWPLLLGAMLLIAVAVGIDLTHDSGLLVVEVLLIIAAVLIGAFVYAEGARHREWWQEIKGDTDQPPATMADGSTNEHERTEES